MPIMKLRKDLEQDDVRSDDHAHIVIDADGALVINDPDVTVDVSEPRSIRPLSHTLQTKPGTHIPVSLCSLNGDLMMPVMTLPSPVEVGNLRAKVQEVRKHQVQLLLGKRVLLDSDELDHSTLLITVIANEKQLLSPFKRKQHIDGILCPGGICGNDYIPRTLMNDKVALADPETMLAAMKYTEKCIDNETSRSDRDVMLAAVKFIASSLKYGGPSIRADREIVLEALKKDAHCLRHAANVLKADKDVVSAAVLKDGMALQYAAPILADDSEVVLIAVSQYGNSLQYASSRLRGNKSIVVTAVKQMGGALQHADPSLKNDQELLKLAALSSKQEESTRSVIDGGNCVSM